MPLKLFELYTKEKKKFWLGSSSRILSKESLMPKLQGSYSRIVHQFASFTNFMQVSNGNSFAKSTGILKDLEDLFFSIHLEEFANWEGWLNINLRPFIIALHNDFISTNSKPQSKYSAKSIKFRYAISNCNWSFIPRLWQLVMIWFSCL